MLAIAKQSNGTGLLAPLNCDTTRVLKFRLVILDSPLRSFLMKVSPESLTVPELSTRRPIAPRSGDLLASARLRRQRPESLQDLPTARSGRPVSGNAGCARGAQGAVRQHEAHRSNRRRRPVAP